MKKFLIIGCGLMFSCLSAMTLPDNVSVVAYEKMTIEPISLFSDVVLLVDHSIVSHFVLELQSPIQLQTFNDVATVTIRESKGFYKPIDYQRFIKTNPLSHYDIYNGRELFKNEFSVENIPRKEVF